MNKPNCQTTNILVAIGLAVAGSIISSIGYVIEKRAHNNINRESRELSLSLSLSLSDIELATANKSSNVSNQSFISNKLWCSGFFIYIIGSIFCAASLKFGAQSVVAPLGSLTLVANGILATKYLNEPFHCNDILGTLFIVIGSVLAVIFGPKSVCSNPTISELKENYIQITFLIFFILLSGITLIDFIVSKYLQCINKKVNDQEMNINENNIKKKRKRRRKQNKINNKYSSYHLYSKYETYTSSEIIMGVSRNKQLFLMISYIYIAAYFGSINVLLMKSSVIIIYTFSLQYLKEWFFWVILCDVIVVNVLLEYFRQKALMYFGALLVIPIYQVLLLIGSILMGAMYFNEFQSFIIYKLILFIAAIIIVLFGIILMTVNLSRNNKNIQYQQNENSLTQRFL